MKKRVSILLVLIMLFVSLSGVWSVGAYFTREDSITKDLNISINGGGVDDRYIDVASGNINYWTFNGTENVLVHSEKYASLAQNITIWGEATENNAFYNQGYEFIGWSVTGFYETNGNNNVKTYKPGDSVSLSTLQAEQGYLYTIGQNTEEYEEIGEIHLQINIYDIYSKNTLTIKQHPSDPVDSDFGYSAFVLFTWDSLEALERVKNGETDGSTAEGDSSSDTSTRDSITLNKIEFKQHYKSGEAALMPPDGEVEEQASILLAEIGMFANLEKYKIISNEQQIDFYFHPNLVFSSSFRKYTGILSTSKYKVNVTDANGVLTTQIKEAESYLYTTNDSDVYNDDGTLKDENMFTGGLTPNGNATYYIADSTPLEGVIARGDFGFESDGSPSTGIACFTTGTLITLADGSKIPVEKLTDQHYLKVYDHDTGSYVATAPLLINYSGDKLYTTAQLNFADGQTIKIINERGLFDITLYKYVYLTPDNCKEFVGHKFAKERADGNGFEAVELQTAYKRLEFTGCYSVTSTYYINHFINGYLTVPGGYHWFVNYFEYGENLKYNEQAKANDIATYGLFTKEDFAPYVPEDMLFLFDVIYPAQYLKVTVGKGLAKFEDILAVIQEWIIYYDLSGKLEQLQ